jgi:hypothetical protein
MGVFSFKEPGFPGHEAASQGGLTKGLLKKG